MKRWMLALGLVALSAVGGVTALFFQYVPLLNIPVATAKTNQSKSSVFQKPLKHVLVNGQPLALEVVTSTASMQEGLGDRPSIPKQQGMLFVFSTEGQYGFWMRHMEFPLDIVWLDRGRVVDMAKRMPAQGLMPIPAIHVPTVNADRVLELNAGESDTYGLTIGSVIPELAF
ncbi:MAG TPA: DUF192 domain-containing protein [Patescibacteria group bacterium]|nr:DUF192 domain-containing protein [Patescibacteria group bacterium]